MTEAEIAALNLKEGDEVEVTYKPGGDIKKGEIGRIEHYFATWKGTMFLGFHLRGEDIPHKIIKRMNYTLETVPVGGTVRDMGGNQRHVLWAIGDGDTRLLFLSLCGEPEEFGSILTVNQAKDYGYTAVNESDNEVVEVDMDEIAKWKGVPVEQIRVKKAE